MNNSLLKIAIESSIHAGKAILEVYKKDFQVDYKEDDSPLTDADRRANSIIMEELEKTDIPIISEESKQTDYSVRKNWTKCWMVDPLDGTKEFVKKNGEFTVNIALIENQKPVLGVIYVPAKDEIYFADINDQKAYFAELKGCKEADEVIELAHAISSDTADELRIVGSRSHMNDDTKAFIEEQKSITDKPISIVSRGSSLKLCLVASGEADLYPRFAPTMEWDTAAGHAICNAAGATLIDQETQQEMLYNRENLTNPYFLVSNQSS
jgi:3'(2'), 5'-bisphosphate nucleotidase